MSMTRLGDAPSVDSLAVCSVQFQHGGSFGKVCRGDWSLAINRARDSPGTSGLVTIMSIPESTYI